MRTIIIFFVAVLFFSACQNSTKEVKISQRQGGKLIVNETERLRFTNPNYINNISSSHILSQVFEGLVKYNTKNLAISSAIANNWYANKGKLIYTFHLRTNIYFHNDDCFATEAEPDKKTRKLNSADIQYSIEKYCTKDYQNKNNEALVNLIKGGIEFFENESVNNIEGIIIENDSTIKIELEKPNPLFVNMIADPALAIVPKEGINKYYEKNRIGTGPFVFSESSEPGILLLKKNANYYLKDKKGKQLPYLDSLEFSFIGSTQKELNLFEKGEIDVVLSLPEKYINQFLEDNINNFEAEPPLYILHQSKDNQEVGIYNLLHGNVKGFYTNRMNYLDFTSVYFEESKVLN